MNIKTKMNYIRNYLTFLILIYCFNILFAYSIPQPKLELIPKGFKVSIPHEDGIKLFAFHGSVNRDLNGIEPGDFSGESLEPIDSYWIYENTKKSLQPGDKLNYWIHVQHGKFAYRALNQSILIPGPFEHDYRDKYSISSTKSDQVTQPTISNTNFSQMQNEKTKNCLISKTIVKGQPVCQGELIFEDNFNKIDWTKWQRESRIPLDTDDADFVSYHDYGINSRNLYVRNGNLHILPTLLTDVGFSPDSIRRGNLSFGASCTGVTDIDRECKRKAGGFRILPPVASARIRSKDFFSFQYGRVEIKAKLPIGDWIFPQIFLEPLNNNYGVTGYASGQMRVAFIHANHILETKDGYDIGGKRLYGGCVLATGEQYRNIGLKSILSNEHLGNNFHTYSLTWTDQSIVLAIDNTAYAEIKGGFKDLHKSHNISHAITWENGENIAPFDKEFYLALGVSAGGISDFPDECRNGIGKSLKPWENTSPKAELRFWNDRQHWHNTWDEENSALTIDYIKVYAL